MPILKKIRGGTEDGSSRMKACIPSGEKKKIRTGPCFYTRSQEKKKTTEYGIWRVDGVKEHAGREEKFY